MSRCVAHLPTTEQERVAMLVSRKNNEAYVFDLTEDILEAISWHVGQGYAGREFLFSKDGTLRRYVDSHKRPMVAVQMALGLRPLSHHTLGRHSVPSQAVTSGELTKAVRAQLGIARSRARTSTRTPGRALNCVWWRRYARCATSRQREINGQEKRQLANLLAA